MKATKPKIQLIQPRHIYAPSPSESVFGHIYLPTSLITIASVLFNGGVDIEFIDENITPNFELSNVIGINLLGAPYIPVVKKFEKKLRNKFGNNYTLFIGGQIVNGLTQKDFTNLFSKNVLNGNNYKTLFDFFNKSIPNKLEDKTSHIPIYELLEDNNLKYYLSNEIAFYLSQGCKFSCTFCSAERTKIINGVRKRVTEKYRDIEIAIKDLEYLILKAKSFNLNFLTIYLSNLDLFQTPQKLREFANKVNKLLIKHGFNIRFRGLATVDSFLKVHKNHKDLINILKEIGLERVGYGIDGATAEVYKQTKKPQTAQMCLDAIRLTSEYSITPETLMVFGHNNKENEESLIKAVEFSKQMLEKYNSYPRPHISKDIVPGNDGWYDLKNKDIIKAFYNDILLFQNLDFTALPSKFTHRDDKFRELVSKYYIEICELPNSLTQYVKPINNSMSEKELKEITNFNKYRYDL